LEALLYKYYYSSVFETKDKMSETKKRGRKPDPLKNISNNGLKAAPLMRKVTKEEYENGVP
jgi:hypothetical protein